MRLQEYEFTIRHRTGKTLQHVDGLSRNPPSSSPTAFLVALAREIDGEGARKKQDRGPDDVWEDEEVLSWIQEKTTEAEPAGAGSGGARGGGIGTKGAGSGGVGAGGRALEVMVLGVLELELEQEEQEWLEKKRLKQEQQEQ
ncbi:unnamed protein product [Closterium sp. NIES-53]